MHPGITKDKSRYEWSLSFFFFFCFFAVSFAPMASDSSRKTKCACLFFFLFPCSSFCVCVHLMFTFRQKLAVYSLAWFYLPGLKCLYGSSPAGLDAKTVPHFPCSFSLRAEAFAVSHRLGLSLWGEGGGRQEANLRKKNEWVLESGGRIK